MSHVSRRTQMIRDYATKHLAWQIANNRKQTAIDKQIEHMKMIHRTLPDLWKMLENAEAK